MAADDDDFLDEPLEPKRSGRGKLASALPAFVIVMMIIDLVICALKGLGVLTQLASIAAANTNPQLKPLLTVLIVGLLAEIAVLCTSIPADIGILLKKRWGLPLGWLAVAATLVSIGVSIWSTMASIQFNPVLNPAQAGGPDPEMMRMAVLGGVALAVFVRVAILIAYVVALIMFSKWLARQEPAADL